MASQDDPLGLFPTAEESDPLGLFTKDAPVQNTGLGGDLATSLKRGVEQLPGIVTGLGDIAPALVFGTRPFEKIATAAGEATGFEPAKWAEEARAEYSPEYRQTAEEIQKTWDDPNATWGQKLGQYVKHPSYTAAQIAESAPSMAAGGVGSRALILAGEGMLARTVGEKMAAPIAAGVGEGVVQTGAAMAQSKDLEDQRKAAIAALGSGAVDAIIGTGAGRLARAAGLDTVETAMAKGFNNTIEKELSLGRRVAGGAISEGLLQELPQSAQEQVWQNYAEGKPLWDNVARSAVEGALAGFVLGGAVNVPGGTVAPTGAPSPTTPDTSLTMSAPGTPIATPAVIPEGAIPYERVAPAWMELAEPGADIDPTLRLTEANKTIDAALAPRAPSNWELAPAGAPMSAPYQALRLPHYKFDTNIVFPDGSTGTQHQVDQHLATLPEAARIPELARMLKGAYVAPPTPTVPHPNATPGSMASAVNIGTANGAITQPVSAQATPTTAAVPPTAAQAAPLLSEGEQNAIRQPGPAGQIPPVGEGRQDIARGGGGVRQGEQGGEVAQARQAAAEVGGVSTQVAQGKLQLKTPEGSWQYVTASPEGFRHTIYPTNAVGAERLAEAKAAHPGIEFRVEPARGASAPAAKPTKAKATPRVGARETVTPAEDAAVGVNAAGEKLYERADGSRYRMHAGRPDFGGDLAPVTTKPDVTLRPHVATLVARKALVDQTAPGLLDKAKQALATGKGKASDFTKAAAMFSTKDEPIRVALKEIATQLGTKPTVKAAVAKAQQNLSVGKTPLSAEPITVTNGVVHIGKYPAMDYETGEDITVADNATPEQIRTALEKGGAISKGHRLFGAGKQPASDVKLSVEPTKAGYSFIRNTLAELLDANPEILRHEKSKSTTLEGALTDILPGIAEVKDAKLVYPKGAATVARRLFEAKDNKFKFYVFESTDGSVYLDIHESVPGAGGSAVYTALGDYAFNTGKRFVGDPSGLSPDAIVRRTANMLFSAIRHGTTKHLGAADEQMQGDPKNGVPPLKWGTNDIDNFNALLHTFTDTIVSNVPEIKNVRYDFERKGFYDAKTGEDLGRDDFQLTANKSGGARSAKAGQGTLRTAALINTLSQAAQGTDRERGRILFGIFNGKVVSGLEDMLSVSAGVQLPQNPHSIKSLHATLIAAHSGSAKKAVQHMLDSGQARIITSDQAARVVGEDTLYGHGGLTRGFFSPSNNTTYFIADHVSRSASAAELRGLVRHEVGVHAYQMGKSSAEFKDVLRQLDMMKRAKNVAVLRAYANVPPRTKPEDIHEEALAYLVQHSPELGIVKRIVAWFRNALRAIGLGRLVGELSTDDILDMVRVAMLRGAVVERTEGFEPKLSVHSYGDLTEEQSATVDRVFGKPPTVMERAKEFRKNWAKSLEQGIFDQFAPIREVSMEGYIKARMSKGGDSTLEAVFMYGKPVLDGNGDIKVEFDAKNKGMNGFANVLAKLDGEQDRFLAWVAALRAGSLKEIGLENLWTESDIATLKTLNRGALQNGRSRESAYNTALKEMMAYNNAVLKIAEQRGLISEETRKMYEATPYVPFYRLADEGAVQGFAAQAGLVNQHAWKKLSGGTNKLNEDLLANMLQNWSHLITASARNDAAKTILEEALRLGVAEEIPAGSPTKGAVIFRENSATKMEGGVRVPSDGPVRNHERSFIIKDDPHLMDAITSLGAVMRVPKPLRLFKHYLTMGVTINPAFKIRNLMRDSIQAMALSELSLNPYKNVWVEGRPLTAKSSEIRAQMLASGAIIRFGSMLDGQTADMGRELVEKMGVPRDHILDDANKVAKFWKHTIKPAFDAYQEIGDRGEQINRAALYKQLVSKGMTHGEAAYWARDLMDFSMSGKWTAIRFLTQTVPFMNARLQGLYKLGRSAQADKKRVAIVTGAVVMASLMLLAAYHDDDDWKKREDWDRDNYWWFKVGGKAIYIPKPFEIGAIGTLAERMAELMGDDEMTGKRFSDLLFNLVNHQLSMNPTPQAIKPLIDLWANKDSFTGKPIETMGMEKLQPEDRYKQSTSGIARALSELGLPNPTQLAMGHYEQMSPVQIDHLVRGYFSWVGTAATTALDYGIFRPMETVERPAMQLQDVFLAGNFVKDLPAGSSRYVTQMYDQAKEIEQAYASYRAALRTGDTERAAELMESEGEKIRQHPMITRIKRLESNLSARARMVERSNLSAEEKRAKLTQIQAQRDLLARKIKP
ncbi:MAG: LPD38 domain-containing protein [Gallionella sp.]|jgi:hypothetical protein